MRTFFEESNRALATWVSSRTYRLALLMVAVHWFLPMVWALSILDVLQRGYKQALVTVLLASLGLALVEMLVGTSNPVNTALSALPVLLTGVALGTLLKRAGNLTLAFQGTVVGSIVLVLLVFSLWPVANNVGEQLQQQMLAMLETIGVDAAQRTEFAALDPGLFTHGVLFMLEIMLLSALMLGYWWYSLLRGTSRFGPEFRALKLGRFAGILLMLLVTLRLLVDWQTIQYAASLALVGFSFQGLAVLHARSYSDHWHWAIVFLVYVSMFTPLSGVAMVGLSTAGLLDNFFRLRAPAERPD